MNGYLLVVEDDAALNQALTLHFADEGYTTDGVTTLAAALEQVKNRAPDVLLVDQQLPDGTGLEVLRRLHVLEPELPVIIMTGMHDLELAIQAIQQGAYDFIHKPIRLEELTHLLARAMEHRRLLRNVSALRDSSASPLPLEAMLGQSQAMLTVSKEIALMAASTARVLITGESGTGKELVARAIHSHSGRDGPFLGVNCAAIVDTLLESDLFGHEKGAFTGAIARKAGKFELATDGTLFLDEIAELTPALQAKLLRVLQSGAFERVGGTQQLVTRARVLAATNRDLKAEVRAGRFREDLLYRLNVLHIHIPPLRDRREDIALLAQGLMERSAQTLHRPALRITDAALCRLQSYDWPGNVRELENVLTQALVRARDPLLTPDLLNLSGTPGSSTTDRPDPFRDASGRWLNLDEIEAQHIQRVLDATQGHKGRTCEILGISRPALERKLQKYRLHLPQRSPF